MREPLPKAGTILILRDKPQWADFTEGKEYTLLEDCIQEVWKYGPYNDLNFLPDVKACIHNDKGEYRRINLNRFKVKGE